MRCISTCVRLLSIWCVGQDCLAECNKCREIVQQPWTALVKDHQIFFMTFSYRHRFAILSGSLCVCSALCTVAIAFFQWKQAIVEMKFLKLYLYSSHNSGKIQDKFAWCVPNTTISYSASVQSIGGKVLRFPLKRCSWSMIQIYVQFMPYATIPVQTGIPQKGFK